MATETTKVTTTGIVGTVLGIAVLAATVYVISWAWKKGQK